MRVIDADGAHVAAIRAHGLTVARGEHRESVPVEAATPDEFDGTVHRVLLAVKAQATDTAMSWIAPPAGTGRLGRLGPERFQRGPDRRMSASAYVRPELSKRFDLPMDRS